MIVQTIYYLDTAQMLQNKLIL